MKNNAAIYIFGLTILCSGLTLLLLTILYKFTPFLFSSTIYYCQELVKTISVHNIPRYVSYSILGFFILSGIYVALRISLLFIQLRFQHLSLHNNRVQTPKSLFSVLNRLGLTDKTRVFQSDKPLAFCFGTLQPNIYLSTALLAELTPYELEAVLIHEKYHLNHHDTMYSLLATMFTYSFSFFPLVHDFIHRYRIAREIYADADVITHSKHGKQQLLSVLKKLLQQDSYQLSPVIPALSTADTLETRIAILTGAEQPSFVLSRYRIMVSIVFTVVLLMLSLTPVQAEEIPNTDTYSVMMCLNAGTCTTWCKETRAKLPTSEGTDTQFNFSPALYTRK